MALEEAEALWAVLRQACPPAVAMAMENAVAREPDRNLHRINPIAFAQRRGLNEDEVIGSFVHAARIGLFELSWNVLCPGCGGVLSAVSTLRTLDRSHYHCALCASGYEATLDEMVEVTFTVDARARRIAGHDQESLPPVEYLRQVFWCSGVDLPEEGLEELLGEFTLELLELPAGQKAVLSLNLPQAFVIVFDPVTHTTQFLDVTGPETRERRALAFALNDVHPPNGTLALAPGPVRITFENQAGRRTLPGVWVAGDAMHELLGRRRPFLTAKRLLSNQTFRDLYRTGTLDPEQRLKITSLTVLFTDLRGSTALYDRVGDLAAFDLVRGHFDVVLSIVAREGGAVVKTIGDAVMATFPTSEAAIRAALGMRGAMREFNQSHGGEDLALNIGLHEGPCLAVMLDERQDYFGQTVNVAARVQGLADSTAILATEPVVGSAAVKRVLADEGCVPTPRRSALRGVAEAVTLYEIR